MSSKPIIAVTAPIRSSEREPGSARLRVSYLAALENARLVPLITAPLRDVSDAAALLDRVDGLLLTGGEDVNPSRYGAVAHQKLGPVSDERDSWELALVLAACGSRLPTLAICRGIQVLNVALGGTLIQDLASSHASDIDHDPTADRSSRTHPIEIQAESRLARAIGVTELRVNSLHHQAIDRAADSLRIVATAPDGTIEGVESAPDSPWWCVGVQWHPEELVDASESWDRGLFEGFAAAVSRSR